MYKRIGASIISAGVLLGISSTSYAELIIEKSSGPVKVIYCSKDANPNEKKAADELAKYIKEITSEELKVVNDDYSPAENESLVIVGENKLSKAAGITKEGLASEGFRKISKNGSLYLLGDDSQNRNGTLFAAYDFIEKECGVRWLWPGKTGEVVPHKKTIRVPELDVTEKPFFQIREFFYAYMRFSTANELKDTAEWMLHQKLGASLKKDLGHSFDKYIRPEEYRDEHPEYFSLVDPANWTGNPKPEKPERTGKDIGMRWQLCTTDKNVRDIIVKKILDKNTDEMQSISPNDAYGYCECQLCRAFDNDPNWKNVYEMPDLSNRYFDYANYIAREIKKKRPGAKVGMHAYSVYTTPPSKIDKLEDNLYIAYCVRSFDFHDPANYKKITGQVEEFAKKNARLIMREYWGDHPTFNRPWLHTKLIDDSFKMFAKYNAAGVYGEVTNDWAPNAINYYLVAKLMWNPAESREKIINDFCDSGFGNAAGNIKEYFTLMENSIDKWCEQQVKEGKPLSYCELLNNTGKIYPDEIIQKSLNILHNASKKAKDEEIKRRIAYLKVGVDYLKIFNKTITAYQQVAAAGINMPFIYPDPSVTALDDASLRNIFEEACKYSYQRQRFLTLNHGSNALDLGILLSADEYTLRPWYWLSQKAKFELNKGNFNYLVNGDFEHDLYSWEVTNEAAVQTDISTNHDDSDNIWAQFHAKQGKSLHVILKPGESCKIASTRLIPADSDRYLWKLSGWVKVSGIGIDKINAGMIWYDSDGASKKILKQDAYMKPCDSEGDWNGLSACDKAPAGVKSYGQMVFELKNDGNSTADIWLDNFKVRKLSF